MLGSSTLYQSECRNISCCSSSGRVYDPSKPPWNATALDASDALGAAGLATSSKWPTTVQLCADAAVLGDVPALQQPGNAADTVGPLGHDMIAKIVCKQGVGHIMETDTHENHLVNVRGPIALRYLRFRLTDYGGNVVDLRGTSLSFCIYLDG